MPVSKCEGLKVYEIRRIYNTYTPKSSAKLSPFWCNAAPDYRLSSEKYNIKVGYWASTVEACFMEVFLRRVKGEYQHKSEILIDKVTQANYHIAEYKLEVPLRIYSIKQSQLDNVTQNAIYSNDLEKDNFVRDCLNAGYDGIEYYSNHSREYKCYALFEKTIKVLSSESEMAPGYTSLSISRAPHIKANLIRHFEGSAKVFFE